MGETTVCSEGIIFEDGLAEGKETFFIGISSNQSNIRLNSNNGQIQLSQTTQIFITDSSGKNI